MPEGDRKPYETVGGFQKVLSTRLTAMYDEYYPNDPNKVEPLSVVDVRRAFANHVGDTFREYSPDQLKELAFHMGKTGIEAFLWYMDREKRGKKKDKKGGDGDMTDDSDE